MTETTKPRIYIAGPMTGLPDMNYPAFYAAADAWRGSTATRRASTGTTWADLAALLAPLRHAGAAAG
jgi:hypothetical protein